MTWQTKLDISSHNYTVSLENKHNVTSKKLIQGKLYYPASFGLRQRWIWECIGYKSIFARYLPEKNLTSYQCPKVMYSVTNNNNNNSLKQ